MGRTMGKGRSMSSARLREQMRSIKEMATLAGVSARTLRYYESLGLICPARTESGYRLYGENDAKAIARILAMRSCGLPLEAIRRLHDAAEDDLLVTLRSHLAVLGERHASTEAAMKKTQAAICALERMNDMNAQDSFEEMKRQGIDRFEETYGAEARALYGDAAIDASNERMMGLTQDEWEAKELLEDAIRVQLRLAMATRDAASEEAQELARMHRKWITMHWGPDYELETYKALVRGYAADPRFTRYYDSAAGEGATQFLINAVDAAF